MNEQFTVELRDVRFFAFHGLYEQEQKTGTYFTVNLKVNYVPQPGSPIKLEDTINYVSLFEIVKTHMSIPEGLLENLVRKIADAIHGRFSFIKEINISIEKTNPPIINMAGNVAVSYKKEF